MSPLLARQQSTNERVRDFACGPTNETARAVERCAALSTRTNRNSVWLAVSSQTLYSARTGEFLSLSEDSALKTENLPNFSLLAIGSTGVAGRPQSHRAYARL